MASSIRVHGVPDSPPVRRVLACLYEKEIDFELVRVDYRKGENKEESFVSLNPLGLLPGFEDGDIKMFESRAITNYIAKVYADKGTQLIYTSGKQMAEMLAWMEVESSQFNPVFRNVVQEYVFKPLRGLPTDTAVVEENKAKLGHILDVYESRLAQSKYLGGDSFTLVDLHHLPTLTFMMDKGWNEVFDSRPHVSSWIGDITSRPAWAKVLAMADQQ